MNENLIYLQDLASLSKIAENYCRFGDDYIMCQITPSTDLPSPSDGAPRFSGFSLCLCTRGTAAGMLDDQPITLTKGSLMVFSRWNSLKFDFNKDNDDFHGEILFISEPFIHDINIDMNALDMHTLFDSKPRPVMDTFTPKELDMVADVFQLLRHNAELGGETVYTRNIARSALQCLVYLLLQVHTLRNKSEDRPATQTRQVGYVQEFMQLLQLHHTRHRSITFYADKLHISPKYLSHIIKETTGKSASDWIGDFVVREAKNMLRFTNKNVQQVAYALNFSTQSSFGKFFKHITGMSPSEFQKS